MDKMKKIYFDKRIIDRSLILKKITQKELDEYIKNLPDLIEMSISQNYSFFSKSTKTIEETLSKIEEK